MKYALISPNEPVYSYDGSLIGQRVADVVSASFSVAEPLFWVSCDDDVQADQFYWNGDNILAIPKREVAPIEVVPNGGPAIVA